MGALRVAGSAEALPDAEPLHPIALPRAQGLAAGPRWPAHGLDAGAGPGHAPAMVRTHKPLGRWPRLSRRQGWWIAAAILLITLLWLVLGTLWFVEWQQSEALAVASRVRDVCELLALPGPPDCLAQWHQAEARIAANRPQYMREAIEAALLVTIIFWVLVAGLIAIAHWIVTGKAPSA